MVILVHKFFEIELMNIIKFKHFLKLLHIGVIVLVQWNKMGKNKHENLRRFIQKMLLPNTKKTHMVSHYLEIRLSIILCNPDCPLSQNKPAQLISQKLSDSTWISINHPISIKHQT